MGEDYIVYSLAGEEELDLNDQTLADLFLGRMRLQLVQEVRAVHEALPAGEEIVHAIEDAVTTDVIDEMLDAGSQSADHPEDVDSPQVASRRSRVMKFIKSPYGIALATVVAGVLTTAAVLTLRKAPEEVTEVLLS